MGRRPSDFHWFNQVSVVSFGSDGWWLGHLGPPPVSPMSHEQASPAHSHSKTEVGEEFLVLAKKT